MERELSGIHDLYRQVLLRSDIYTWIVHQCSIRLMRACPNTHTRTHAHIRIAVHADHGLNNDLQNSDYNY